jgi:C1A family cysteine protease
VSVDVNGSFGGYSSGVFDGCGSTGTNHMVTLEGWTDDTRYASNGGGYWRMRNSWGDWGDHGKMNIVYKSKGGRNCNGIGNTAVYAIIEGLEPSKLAKKLIKQ